MLSALITSQRGYPTMLLAEQLVHQWLVHPGPLVLGTNLFNFPTPTEDRDRTVSRRSEPSSRVFAAGSAPSTKGPACVLRIKTPGRRGHTWEPSVVSLGASTSKMSRYRCSEPRPSYLELMARMVSRALAQRTPLRAPGLSPGLLPARPAAHLAHATAPRQRVATGVPCLGWLANPGAAAAAPRGWKIQPAARSAAAVHRWLGPGNRPQRPPSPAHTARPAPPPAAPWAPAGAAPKGPSAGHGAGPGRWRAAAAAPRWPTAAGRPRPRCGGWHGLATWAARR